jgi:MFS family permease
MSTLSSPAKPTNVRYTVIGALAFSAFLMYLDRACMSQIVAADSFKRELGLDKTAVGYVLSGFFFAYALGQMPAAWFGDRFGARPLLTTLIIIWSGFTLMTGFAVGLWSLILARIGCGLAEAGAFPCSGRLIPRWTPLTRRGGANAIVAGGGRLGGAVAPWLTGLLIVGWTWGSWHIPANWRTPALIFGVVGIFFALAFWRICRDRPSEHTGCNQAERDLIEHDPASALVEGATAPRTKLPEQTPVRLRTPWKGLVTSRDMWLMCLYQFLTNVGWAFLITSMPSFLREAKGLGEKEAGLMATMALLAGIGGMLAGGWLTDTLTRHFGLRKGRMIPMVWSRLAGAIAYLICIKLQSPWVAVAAFAMVAAMTDISIPATWGYIQDVGGRNIASSFAWPNMWGNFGAALTAPMLTWINHKADPHPSIETWLYSTNNPHHDWNASLIFLAGAFFLSGFAAYWIRADVKIEPAAG